MVAFAEEYGRPVYFDMSAEMPYAGLIGQTVERARVYSDISDCPELNVLELWIGQTRVRCRYHIENLVVYVEPLSSLRGYLEPPDGDDR